jgi:hypothetical protein
MKILRGCEWIYNWEYFNFERENVIRWIDNLALEEFF